MNATLTVAWEPQPTRPALLSEHHQPALIGPVKLFVCGHKRTTRLHPGDNLRLLDVMDASPEPESWYRAIALLLLTLALRVVYP